MKIKAFALALLASISTTAIALPAFLGAEGSGALSVGGRGGVVCQVTNLNDSGAGSLRACAEMSGPRTVVFRVGGTINLATRITITNPYITIAGHTAPGGGIQLRGSALANYQDLIFVSTNDVILRYLTLRQGYKPTGIRGVSISIGNTGGASSSPQRIVADHISMSWNGDKMFGSWAGDPPTYTATHAPKDITLQNSILAEAFEVHPTNLVTGSNTGSNAEAMTNIDVIRNVFATVGHRNPLMKNRSGRVINNIIYNWKLYATQIGTGGVYDIVNNLYKHPNVAGLPVGYESEIQAYVITVNCNSDSFIQDDPSLYVAGNQGPIYGTDNVEMVKRVFCQNGKIAETLPAQYRRTSPLPAAAVPITVLSIAELETALYPTIGDSRRLDCDGSWVAKRDDADVRIVSNVQNNTLVSGISNENEVGGFPTIANGTPCADADSDGMPDVWEDARGLDKNDAADRNTLDASGYTMLEVYLNGGDSVPAPINMQVSW